MFTAAAGVAAALAACQPQTEASADVGVIVSAEWLADHLEAPDLVVLAVGRSAQDFAAAHISGARFISVDDIRGTRDGIPSQLAADADLFDLLEGAGVSDGSRVVVYGTPLEAARLFYTLEYVGLGQVSVLDGGLAAWRAGGHPIATDTPTGAVARGTITRTPNRSVTVDADWINERLDAPGIALVDARSPEEFNGSRLSRGTGRPGHIPGASNLPWDRVVVSPEMPLLRGPAELERLLAGARVARGDTVVNYCRTGMRAAVVHLAARALGYESVVYDGSYLDWSARPDLPVAR